jgi:hypothetical protein
MVICHRCWEERRVENKIKEIRKIQNYISPYE